MSDDKRPHVVCCGILKKEVQKLVNEKSLDVKLHFLDAGLHIDYAKLEKVLTSAIEVCSKHEAKGVVIAYGDLCHPKIKEIVGKYGNSVKVDALNCIDCLLGGHGKLLQIDPNSDHFYLSMDGCPQTWKKTKISVKSLIGAKKR
jgi:hypothetical protein